MSAKSSTATVKRSSRHTTISGNFGEHFVLYWLSKSGIECVHVDHTGIDIIARDPQQSRPMGISVKNRTRDVTATKNHVGIADSAEEFQLIDRACQTFGCDAYLAIVDVLPNTIYMFLVSKKHYMTLRNPQNITYTWNMSQQSLKEYAEDSQIRSVILKIDETHW